MINSFPQSQSRHVERKFCKLSNKRHRLVEQLKGARRCMLGRGQLLRILKDIDTAKEPDEHESDSLFERVDIRQHFLRPQPNKLSQTLSHSSRPKAAEQLSFTAEIPVYHGPFQFHYTDQKGEYMRMIKEYLQNRKMPAHLLLPESIQKQHVVKALAKKTTRPISSVVSKPEKQLARPKTAIDKGQHKQANFRPISALPIAKERRVENAFELVIKQAGMSILNFKSSCNQGGTQPSEYRSKASLRPSTAAQPRVLSGQACYSRREKLAGGRGQVTVETLALQGKSGGEDCVPENLQISLSELQLD